jgi:hypothetical protein
MLEGWLQPVQADEDVVWTSRIRELEWRVRELERLLGRKKSSSRCCTDKKADLAAPVVERSQGRFAMKADSDMLRIARSKLIERSDRATPRARYRK